ncbi:phosphate acyltransferase [Macrococcoides caseolyticum]|uniref:phosphate acyltransferase n=1 Tax=Macrococcoides caseolyticum TaxID=69966 RepID=UPI001F37BDA7|nr:phosphate acyltransferase [Macrococcus caseolyticus]MCE4956586.1 phosphate acetyltransferase [Macrococcus caseolyticus]
MIKIAIPGGSRPEILEVITRAKQIYKDVVSFFVFDRKENIDNADVWVYEQCATDEDSVKKAVEMVARGEAQILMKGIVETRTILKEVLQKKHNLKNQSVLSHVAMVNLPGNKPLLLTDAAMNINPTTDQLKQITDNAINVCHRIGIACPKVAIISSAESFNSKMPSSVLAHDVAKRFGGNSDAIVAGPISLDLAISIDAVKHKGYTGAIAGDADVLVVPTIDVGNVLYKAFSVIGKAVIGGTIVGAKVPIVLTSRSDSTESKLYALDFAVRQVRD